MTEANDVIADYALLVALEALTEAEKRRGRRNIILPSHSHENLDHGGFSGLLDDDHTQYVKKAGDTMTGTLNATSILLYDIESRSGNLIIQPNAASEEIWIKSWDPVMGNVSVARAKLGYFQILSSGQIDPAAHDTYSLGLTDRRFYDLFLSHFLYCGKIYMDTTFNPTISFDSGDWMIYDRDNDIIRFYFGSLSAVQINSGGITLEDNMFLALGKDSDGALPAASSSYRGKMIRVEGGAGVADKTYQCMKAADESYSWVEVASG